MHVNVLLNVLFLLPSHMWDSAADRELLVDTDATITRSTLLMRERGQAEWTQHLTGNVLFVQFVTDNLQQSPHGDKCKNKTKQIKTVELLLTWHGAPCTHCSEQQASHSEHDAHIVPVISLRCGAVK